jgi:hypothetical protein
LYPPVMANILPLSNTAAVGHRRAVGKRHDAVNDDVEEEEEDDEVHNGDTIVLATAGAEEGGKNGV